MFLKEIFKKNRNIFFLHIFIFSFALIHFENDKRGVTEQDSIFMFLGFGLHSWKLLHPEYCVMLFLSGKIQ